MSAPMADQFISDHGLEVSRGGQGARLAVLLHGLGANRAVWSRMTEIADRHWDGRWLAPDLRGHGGSPARGPFGYAAHAADIADLIKDDDPAKTVLVGHSFGGVIAALAGSGLYGPRVHDTAAFGVKIVWTADETAKARELAARPAKTFATREEAIERALKLAGLHGLADPASTVAANGIVAEGAQWRVAMDPRVFGAVGPSVPDLLRLAPNLRLASGDKDTMVSLADMRAVDPAAWTIAGAGHNVHWENPVAVWDFVKSNKDA
jgi:pimeloyl-ACP methyl ester carboxylesterase